MSAPFKRVIQNIVESEVKKSRFIGYAYPIDDEENAKAILENLRIAHKGATHVCYAYIADEAAAVTRYGDDGEPSGTAGLPIMNALSSSGCKKSLIAVVRYFGGVKLGAGNLSRVYGNVAAMLAKDSAMYKIQMVIKFQVDYNGYAQAKRAVELSGKILSSEFLEKIAVTAAVDSTFGLERYSPIVSGTILSQIEQSE